MIDWDASLSDPATFEINRPGHARVDSPARLDGTFEIDVTRLFLPRLDEQRSGVESEVEIHVRHADYLSAREIIAGELVSSLRQNTGRVELQRDIRLRRAAAVAGHVRIEGESDRSEVQVHLLRGETQGFSGPGALASTSCGEDGRFRLKAPGSGEFIALAEHERFIPVAVRVLLTEGATLELPDLVLQAGTAAIQGRVDLPPGVDLLENYHPGLPGFSFIPQARVHGRPWNRSEMKQRSLPAESLVLVTAANASQFTELRGGWPNKWPTARINADGSFNLTGLDIGDWELQIHGIQSSALLQMRERTIVSAPASDVVLGRHLCRITAVVTESGKPVENAEIKWQSTTEVGDNQVNLTRTSGDGVVVVIGDMSMDYRAVVTRDGRIEATVDIPAAGRPRDSRIPIAVTEAARPAQLVLDIAAGARPYERIHVRLRPIAAANETIDRSHSRIDRRCELKGATYTIEEITPGRYAIEVGPSEDRGPVAFYGGFLMTERFDIDFAAGALERRVLSLQTGGRLRVEAQGFSGFNHMAPCTLLDSQGRPVEGPFVVAEEGDGSGTFYQRNSELSLKFPSAPWHCLLPGNYTLQVTSTEFDTDPVNLEIRELETTIVRPKLRRR